MEAELCLSSRRTRKELLSSLPRQLRREFNAIDATLAEVWNDVRRGHCEGLQECLTAAERGMRGFVDMWTAWATAWCAEDAEDGGWGCLWDEAPVEGDELRELAHTATRTANQLDELGHSDEADIVDDMLADLDELAGGNGQCRQGRTAQKTVIIYNNNNYNTQNTMEVKGNLIVNGNYIESQTINVSGDLLMGQSEHENSDDCEPAEVLASAEAERLWQQARQRGWVDDDCRPLVTNNEAALLVDRMAQRLGIRDKWKTFGAFWGMKPDTLRSAFNKAMEQRKSLDFQDLLAEAFDGTV